ncbi:DUF7373 family lipoprotein [Mycolicibacterium setense]
MIGGEAVKDPAVAADAVNTALLQPGNYDTAPYANPKPEVNGARQVDAQRLSDHVTGPWEVDPAFTEPLMAVIGPALSDKGVDHVMGAPAGQIAVDHGFINGFVTGRASTLEADKPRTSLTNFVLRFPTAEDAAAFAGAARDIPSFLTNPEPTTIPGHPEALAIRGLYDGSSEVVSFAAHGPYVLYQISRTNEGRNLEEVVAKTLDLQIPAVDAFKPTDPAQFPTMELDPTHLIARTLRIDKPTTMQGVYGRHGVLHYDHPSLAEPLDTAGVDAASIGQSQMYVFQARDTAAAKELAATIADSLAKDAKPSVEVPGMPTARCFDAAGAGILMMRASCVVAADRWVLQSSSQQPRDAAQQLAAQYLMLVGK